MTGHHPNVQVRLLSRQHAFGGFARFGPPLPPPPPPPPPSRPSPPSPPSPPSEACVCTRHHAIDWNFVGSRRTRPNKWRIRPVRSVETTDEASGEASVDVWDELSFAHDEHGAPYYYETWSRRPEGYCADCNPMAIDGR